MFIGLFISHFCNFCQLCFSIFVQKLFEFCSRCSSMWWVTGTAVVILQLNWMSWSWFMFTSESVYFSSSSSIFVVILQDNNGNELDIGWSVKAVSFGLWLEGRQFNPLDWQDSPPLEQGPLTTKNLLQGSCWWDCGCTGQAWMWLRRSWSRQTTPQTAFPKNNKG